MNALEPWLLEVLCCPESHQKLCLGTAAQIELFNAGVASGRWRTRDGRPVEQNVEGLLIREDGVWAYVIREGLPVLLVDEAVAWNA
jgi:uncharacterized protein YbaR (Trm112 family)